jgi:hypothetical protein
MVEDKGHDSTKNEDEFMDRDEELEDAETFAELLDSTHKALKPGEVVKGYRRAERIPIPSWSMSGTNLKGLSR